MLSKPACVLMPLLFVAAWLSSCATPRQISSGNTNQCMNRASHRRNVHRCARRRSSHVGAAHRGHMRGVAEPDMAGTLARRLRRVAFDRLPEAQHGGPESYRTGGRESCETDMLLEQQSRDDDPK